MVTPMQLDRISAKALVEAGYMPLDQYVEMFGMDVEAEARARADKAQLRPWTTPAHFERTIEPSQYRVTIQQRNIRIRR